MKILFLVRELNYGGAERQLVLLANELARRGHNVAIAVFYGGGPLENEVVRSQVRLISLEKRSRWDLLSFYWKLLRVVRRERPDVLYGWMSGPNLVANMVRIWCPKVSVFWGVRCSNLEIILDRVESIVNWFDSWMSRFADCIVVNSREGFDYAVSRGFPPEKMTYIPNGIDVTTLYPDPFAGKKVRAEWGFTGSERLIGLVGRLNLIKGHDIFLKAAARLAPELAETRFVCIGSGPAQYQAKLQALSCNLGLAQKVRWVPARSDMRAVYNALDVICLSSLSEGFPNVIGEAMACAKRCVVTDVGDCRLLVGDDGVVVPANDEEALAEGLRQALTAGRDPNERGRQRIVEHFTVTHLADRTEQVILEYCSDHRQAAPGYVTQTPAGTH
jgi:glycosyltransferase involved in cell wall biosynthesis